MKICSKTNDAYTIDVVNKKNLGLRKKNLELLDK